MIVCTNCGSTITDSDAIFCEECGFQIQETKKTFNKFSKPNDLTNTTNTDKKVRFIRSKK